MAGMNEKLAGLLGNPMLNIGTGLLAASGPSMQPKGFGQVLGEGMQFASQRQAQQMQLQAMREEMQAKRERQEAMQQLQGLIAPNEQGVMPMQTPEGQQQMLGLLGQVAPEAMAQGLMAQVFAQPDQPRLPASMQEFSALYPGVDVGTPEGREMYLAHQMNKDPTGAVMKEAQLELLMQQLQDARESRLARQESAAEERAATRREVVYDLRKLEEMAELNDRLRGTLVESGRSFSDLRRVAVDGWQGIKEMFGGDATQQQQMKDDYDRFSKLTTDFVIGSLDRLAGTGTLTDAKFGALMDASASIGASPGANDLVIADLIEGLLDAAELEGFDVPRFDQRRDLARRLRSSGRPPAPPAPPAPQSQGETPSVIDWNQLPD